MNTQPISKQLRAAIANCELTRYRLSKLTGIDDSTLSKFCAGKVGMTLASIDALGKVLGLRIVSDTTRADKPASKRKAKGTR